MAQLSIDNVKISGISTVVPSREVSNLEFYKEEESIEKIVSLTGINKRRESKYLSARFMCQEAANRLMNALDWSPLDIDLIVFVTQTPECMIPGGASRLQDQLGVPNSCMVIDVNQGCSGYVYGLSLAASLLSHGTIKKALLCVGDTMSQIVDKDNLGTATIFSDAGSCTALSYDLLAQTLNFNLQTDGSGRDLIHQKFTNSTLKMDGTGIYVFGLKEIKKNIEQLFKNMCIEASQVAGFIMHQANKLLNDSIIKQLGQDSWKFPSSLSRYGNTSNATIPLTICLHHDSFNEKVKNELYCIAGFGVGLTWGSAVINLDQTLILDVIEISDEKH